MDEIKANKNNINYISIKKGIILYKPKTDFNIRFVVVDYDEDYVYCIDLNNEDKIRRYIDTFSYKYCNENFEIE